MNKIILLIFCAHLLLISNVSAKFVSCDYNEMENFIYFVKHVQYTCELSLSETKSYKKITGIGGNHDDDQYDESVYAVKITSEDSTLTELTNVICKKFDNLEYLSIVDLKINTINEDSFQKCPNLTLLYLEKNKLQNIPEKLLSTNTQLIDFKLSSSEIKSLPENIFEMQENLKRLDLMNNKIESLPAGVFRSLTKLQRLYLSENQLTELNIECFKSLRSLTILELSKNKITELPENIFKSSVNLTMLEMNNNKLSEIHADSFAGTGKLNGIKFDYNKIYSIESKLIHNNPVGVIHMLKNICFDGHINIRNKQMNEKLKRCFKRHEPRTTTTTEEITTSEETTTTEELTTTSTKKTTKSTKPPTSTTTQPPTSTTTKILTTKPLTTKPKTTTTTQSFIDDDNAEWISSDYADSTISYKLPILSSTTTNKPTTKEPTTTKPLITTTSSPIINIQPIVSTTQKPIEKTCGVKHHSIKDIKAGQTLAHGQFPWNVAIFTTKGVFKCGGVLVTSRKIVTSAKCMYKTEAKKATQVLPRDIIVILGSHNLYKLFEVGKVSMAVETIHIHEDFKVHSQVVDADIAVIVLSSEATLNKYINTICLIDPDKNLSNITDGIIISNAHSEAMKYRPEMAPKKMDVHIFDYEECLDKTEDFAEISTNRSICTGENEEPVICDNDMGSGLYVKYENRYYFRGIVSTPVGDDQTKCDEYGYTLITDIAKFSEWIEKLPDHSRDFNTEEQSEEYS